MNMKPSLIRATGPLAVAGLGLLLLAACGGGGGGGVSSDGAGYTVGGTITGLASGSSVTLETAGASPVVRSANGSFTFAQRYGSGSPYHVRVTDHTRQNLQDCTVDNGTGSVGTANVTNVEVKCQDVVLLSASTGNEEITLRWTQPFVPEPTGMLMCVQEVSGVSNADPGHLFDQVDACIGGVDLDVSSLSHDNGRYERVHEGLNNGDTYFYQVRMKAGDKVVYSNVAFTSPRVAWDHPGDAPFNDTGITQWSDGVTLLSAPPINDTHPGQDADHGRDAVNPDKFNDDAFGQAAFDYTRIAADSRDQTFSMGVEPGVRARDWACIRDNVSGLMWEIRPSTAGHYRNLLWRYTWYSNNDDTNAGSVGTHRGVSCGETLFSCNTQRYVERVNALGLCGYTDWRLPTLSELYSLGHFGRALPPAVDPDAFPDTNTLASTGAIYWSGTPSATDQDRAWRMRFHDARDSMAAKSASHFVRLVREEADIPPALVLADTVETRDVSRGVECEPDMHPTASQTGFETGGVIPAGYACQKGTGLLWRRCPLGLAWDAVSSSCQEAVAEVASWRDTLGSVSALSEAGGNWRLPNIKELNSIIERRCSNPAVDTRVFPVIPAGTIWSASPVAANPASVWSAQLNVTSGGDDDSGAGDLGSALIVRDDAVTCPP